MYLVAGIPTKNEEWIIGKTLSVISKFCDKVVILDDNSTDRTEDICRTFVNVEFIKRKRTSNILYTGMSALGKTELFGQISKYNPKYILMLDADEIPTPSFINFLKQIDISNHNINAWKPRFINLYNDEKHYRIDSLKTKNGTNVNWNPFSNNAWRKVVLLRYNKQYKYTYHTENVIGSVGKNHPLPCNIPKPIVNTEEFYIIHYGKLNNKYLNGEKDKLYAKIYAESGLGNYQERLTHHYLCRISGTPILKQCPKQWFWN